MTKVTVPKAHKRPLNILPVHINPPSVAPAENIPLPDYAKGASDLKALVLFKGSDGTVAADVLTYAIVEKGTATPPSGHACLYDENNIRMGDGLTARDMILAMLEYESVSFHV